MANVDRATQGQVDSMPPHPQTESSKLEDQAATAALYNKSQPEPKPKPGDRYPLDEHHKLSAAGAAASLKYAKPNELPSYPVVGLSNKASSAGAAASLANAHQKPFEHWKPDPSASASAAAVLAKDYKMAELWGPGSTEYGHSAAIQALRAGEGLSPQLDYGYTADGHKRSLRASTLAMSGSRKRADSNPVLPPNYPDSANAGHNALNAATSAAYKSSTAGRLDEEHVYDDLSPALSASRIRNIKGNVPREMFGSHPPVGIEVEERKKQESLHSAAVAMAKQMYELQQKTIATAAQRGATSSFSAANAVGSRQSKGATTGDLNSGTMRVTNLEEAAKKLAAERLAKLHDEHAAYREYYGTNVPASRSSLRAKTRRRASSMGQVSDEDEARSRQIRAEMSVFNKNVAEIDTKKRQKDREALMAAAQRNVRASMHGIDEKVFAQTGKVSPAMMEEWEAKARAAAEADSNVRMANYGKVNIGGGKFIDQADVDAVATRNVQPVLDEINNKAELHRAKQEEIRLDREETKRQAEEQKARGKELKMELKKIKGHDKAEERARKQEEKAKKAAEKRRVKGEQQESKEAPTMTAAGAPATADIEEDTEAVASRTPPEVIADKENSAPEIPPLPFESSEQTPQVPVVVETTTVVAAVTTTEAVLPDTPSEPKPATKQPAKVDTAAAVAAESSESKTSPKTSPKSEPRVVSWIKDKFGRRASKSQKVDEPHPSKPVDIDNAKVAAPSGASAGERPVHGSPSSVERRDSSIRDVAMAGRAESDLGDERHPEHTATTTAAAVVPVPAAVKETSHDEHEPEHGEDDADIRQSRRRTRSPSPPISPLSEENNGKDIDVGAKGGEKEKTRETKKEVETDEARDKFDDKLVPPPNFATRASDSPVRDSRFLENL